jgi:uncharacterized protein (DUF2062 family)
LKIRGFFKKLAARLVAFEPSASRVAASCCLGICLGASPFLGFQTWILLPLDWVLRLNVKVSLVVLYLVNNPFTMLPIAVADYATGHYVLEWALGINLISYNPSFMSWINTKIGPTIYHYLGIEQLCFWCYILGGVLFCLLVSWPLYWLLKHSFDRFMMLHRG